MRTKRYITLKLREGAKGGGAKNTRGAGHGVGNAVRYRSYLSLHTYHVFITGITILKIDTAKNLDNTLPIAMLNYLSRAYLH